MSKKIKRTTFGVVTSHIISSSALFPFFWLIAGSLGKALLLANGTISEYYALLIYYFGMLLSFYFGIKYSLYYINKRVVVPLPNQSGYYSIILFSILVIAVNYGLYYFEEFINIYRLSMSLALLYIFMVMTKKYFNSLEKTDDLECNFFVQIIILLANFFLSVIPFMLVHLSSIIPKSNIWIKQFILIISIYTGVVLLHSINILNNKPMFKLYTQLFYKEDEVKPFKKAFIVLTITLLINIFIYMLIIKLEE